MLLQGFDTWSSYAQDVFPSGLSGRQYGVQIHGSCHAPSANDFAGKYTLKKEF